MNHQAYTVNPVYSEEDGSYLDTEILHNHHSAAVDNSGVVRGYEELFVEDEYGQQIYQAPDEEFDDVSDFSEDEYIEDLLSTLPVDHNTMVYWAAENLSPEWIQLYDSLIDSEDLDSLHQALEMLTKEYLEANPQPENVEEEEEISDDEFTEAFETLNQSEPLGTETAYAFLEAAEQTEPGAYQDALILSAQYHRGEINAQDAFETLINKYGVSAAAKVYRDLTSD